ncbi:hypothetical protein [Flavonifractor plautii]|jgi:hypothetical protein|uniref:hypothetical protein n=1 Tax=Flavonifractor plautii TaxID=292800 RepID=UPI0012E84433|nr:hypothetical protein [Flavonifractor plautii]MCB5584627.1 hypothetical protein [Flavonifractor plautii]
MKTENLTVVRLKNGGREVKNRSIDGDFAFVSMKRSQLLPKLLQKFLKVVQKK